MLLKVVRICNSQSNCNYLKNQKLFLTFLFHFLNLYQILNFLKKTWLSHLLYCRNYRLLISWLDHSPKSAVSEHTLTLNMWKLPWKLVKCLWECFNHVFSLFSGNIIWKMSLLLLGEILGVFVNTLTSDDKYPVQGCENLQLPIQMQLSEKRNTLFQFLFHFWILHQILNILTQNMMVIANLFPKLQTVKILVRKLSQKHRFRTGFGSQHVKASQMLPKFPWEHFYYVFLSFSMKLIWKMSPYC